MSLSLADGFVQQVLTAEPKKDKMAGALVKKAGGTSLFWRAENRGKHDPNCSGTANMMAKKIVKKYNMQFCECFKLKDELPDRVFAFLETGKIAD